MQDFGQSDHRYHFLVGFESLEEENLRQMNKAVNIKVGQRNALEKDEPVKRIHDAGIGIYATFVLGYDHDTEATIEKTLRFSEKHKFYTAAFNHLLPFPGTELYRRIEAEHRLLYDKWWLQEDYHYGEVAFRPKNMTPERLSQVCKEARGDEVRGCEMPEYCFPGEYHTFFCKTGKRGGCRMPEGMEIKFCSGEEVALFYLEQCEKGNLSVENVVQNDLYHADFYGLYLKGKLQAVGYVLDQRHYKQYVVDHYEGIYRVVSRLPTGLLGFPDFPKPGEAAPVRPPASGAAKA